MKAVGYQKMLPITDAKSLFDFDAEKPEPKGRDIRVAVKAISVNPVDTKVRKRAEPPEGETKILGYDATGVVDAVGPDVTLFKKGDEVWYAGSILRQGTNAEFHLVDERIVGRKPTSLSFAQAAALPLTTITAWELLFDRLGVAKGGGADASLLIVGGAGGVGSILIQLARKLTQLKVIATASRPESSKWCLDLGAHHVVDHSKSMKEQIVALNSPPVAYIAALTNTDQHFPALAEIVAPQGRIGLIDDPNPGPNVMLLKGKAVSLHWESMFTRSSFQTADMIEQHKLLNETAALIDNGTLRTTLDKTLGTINAANLKQAHALIESGRATGKVVLEGW